MFRVLKKFFIVDSQKTGLSTKEEFESNLRSNPNFLTAPHKITKLLQDIEKASPLCTIVIDDSKEEFSSSILNIQTAKKLILLDELTPQHGNKLVREKKTIKLSTYFNGIHLAFKLNKIQFGSAQGIVYYKADFPERIYYPQRRKSHRIEIKSLRIPFSGIANKNDASIGGHVFDLSRGGIGIKLSDSRVRLQRGDILKNCRFTLDDYCMEFDLIVRFAKRIGSTDPQTIIGGYFENTPPKSLNKLSYFITALEREEIRKQKT